MNCFYCKKQVRWNNDYDIEDEDEEYEIVSMYQCDGCGAWYEVYTGKKKKYDA